MKRFFDSVGGMCLRSGRTATLTVVALVLLAGFVATPVAGAAGTLDQSQQTDGGSGYCADNAQWPAQTFTAGITGHLDQVDLELVRQLSGYGPLPVQIRNVV